MVKRRPRRFWHDESATALIEFAVVLPLLLLLALGMVDTTRYVWLSNDLARAVDGGARLAAATGGSISQSVTTTTAISRVRALIQDPRRTEGSVSVAYIQRNGNVYVRVVLAQYPFTFLTPGVRLLVPGSQQLQVQAEFRMQ